MSIHWLHAWQPSGEGAGARPEPAEPRSLPGEQRGVSLRLSWVRVIAAPTVSGRDVMRAVDEPTYEPPAQRAA